MNIWITVYKLFKARGVNFFRGYKGQRLGQEDGAINPKDSSINFAVPSDKTLRLESEKYKINVNDPGIIQTTLDIFAEKQNGEDVKLCIDGKKLAYGHGNSGEEHLM